MERPDLDHVKAKVVDEASTEIVKRPPTRHDPGSAACLIQIHPPELCIGGRHHVGSEPLLIGRDPACHICLSDHSVSRVHARIATVGGDYYLTDNRSTNGTFVNDEPVFLRRLSDGDYLRVGRHIFRFLAGGNIEALYHEEICRLVVTDPLTEIGNRRCLLEFLERELARARRYQRPLSLVLFDLDRFKEINDQWGHLAGDGALRDLTARLRGAIRSEDLLARTGGDEFALALLECPHAGALELAERLRTLVDAEPFAFQGHRYPLTISLGVATVSPPDVVSPSQLIIRADEKLYEAKRAGGNRSAG